MTTERDLIVNADDFGMSEGTNAGILRAHEHGIVTSASLMVYGEAAESAAAHARRHPGLSVGLHVDLGEWLYEQGEWTQRYERGPADQELRAQLERFRDLLGRDPTHLDSHQHVHREPPANAVFLDVAHALGIPLRGCGPIAYEGGFYGQTGTGDPLPNAVLPEALVTLLRKVPAGVTELGCHPGLDSDLDSSYRVERLREVEALCDPRVRDAVAAEGICLRSFAG